jgi:hypothetical protein
MANAVFFNLNVYPDLWKEVYTQHKAERAVEYDIELQGLGLASEKPEGAPVSMSQMNELYKTHYITTTYGIGFQITREAIEDNVYKQQFPQQALNLRSSLSTVKNVNGAYLFNNAFNANSIGADGQPLCSTQHPTAAGFVANTFNVNVGLNESSLEDAITGIKGFTNAAGLKINTSPVKLIVPQAAAFKASRLLNSAYTPDSGNNAINAIVHDKWIPGGIHVNQFILNPNLWGVLTDEIQGFKYYSRTPIDIDFITDIGIDAVTVRAVERYAMGYTNFRCFWGSIGA